MIWTRIRVNKKFIRVNTKVKYIVEEIFTKTKSMKTNQLKKVLIALDYDQTALKVAEEGLLLSKTLGAEVVLLHVISDPVYYASTEYSPVMGFTDYSGLAPFQLDTVEGLRKAAQHFLDKTKRHLGDPTILTVVKEGDIADSIFEAAKETHADVIVLGSHSRKWLENIILGSVAEKVLKQTRIPLFIIPTKKRV
jgi:nucleotide-binding universal stress UspA family protein